MSNVSIAKSTVNLTSADGLSLYNVERKESSTLWCMVVMIQSSVVRSMITDNVPKFNKMSRVLILGDRHTWWRHQMETFSALLVLCGGEFIRHRYIHLANASDAELWYFLWSAPVQTVDQPRDEGELGRNRAHCDVTVMAIIDIIKDDLIKETFKFDVFDAKFWEKRHHNNLSCRHRPGHQS